LFNKFITILAKSQQNRSVTIMMPRPNAYHVRLPVGNNVEHFCTCHSIATQAQRCLHQGIATAAMPKQTGLQARPARYTDSCGRYKSADATAVHDISRSSGNKKFQPHPSFLFSYSNVTVGEINTALSSSAKHKTYPLKQHVI